jgi:hypothetical protein
VGYPTPWKSSVSDNYRIVARVAMTERGRAYRCGFMCQFRERRMPDMFLELSFSRGVHSYNIIHPWRSQWLRNIKAPKTIHQQLSIMSMRLTTIVKPPSIMRAELMKKRGIMPTWPMAMLAMQSIMQRKRVNITLRNTGRKNRPINHGRSAQCSLSRDNNGRQWRLARRLHRTGDQKCPFAFIWRHGDLRAFLPAELRLRSKQEAQADLPRGRM